ncbi:uncharacterized protein LOC109857817 [Pseudomyrmex gracilis]|uniref:uncharacterized protein LOC109857817 n=1 Tax=Pseudomyrmex gracilis TaxID=219809 RepID=UPI000994BCFC|nr:uncharacterized protein LOC109857817 [Pseudomyrmex gracilis]XP_020290128.1 uncharacterized protein LOC109857817 [Pseudomyrmex gracilis]XP_020290129.1 uncharacterized protein LOC109857817 [Pseudomyrmex gracilis]
MCVCVFCMRHVSVLIARKMEATMQAKTTRTSANVSYILYTMLLSGVVMVVLYWMICHFLSRTSQSYRERRNSSKNSLTQKKTTSDAVSSYLTSKHENNTKRIKQKKKREPQEFSHHWKLATLKGHTGSIYNMSVSGNRKYVASCAEGSAHENNDKFPGKQSFQRDNRIRTRKKRQELHPTASNLNVLVYNTQRNEDIVDNRRYLPSVNISMPIIGFVNQDHSVAPIQLIQINYISKTKKYLTSQENNMNVPRGSYVSERSKIPNLTDPDIANILSKYLLTIQELSSYGFPTRLLDRVIIKYKPYKRTSSSAEQSDQEQEIDDAESSDNNSNDELATNNQIKLIKRSCSRCIKDFYVDQNGKCVTEETCYYHWGKRKYYSYNKSDAHWSCCNQKIESCTTACTTAKQHVWIGLVPGENGPYTDFVFTDSSQAKEKSVTGYDGVYALDCEMCFTQNGLELTRVSVVNMKGIPIYNEFVKPKFEIIDYNSRFSGIEEKDLKNVIKTLEDVQRDLLQFINANTILIGHGLESDLRVLRLYHNRIIDTSLLFTKDSGHRKSLQGLSSTLLNRKIQDSTHDSLEDSCAAMDLVMKKLNEDLANRGNSIHLSSRERERLREYEEGERVRRDFQEIVTMRCEN